MKYKIGNDTWEIVETAPSGLFVTIKNGQPFECCAGAEYETESGATYAIMNEYSVENLANEEEESLKAVKNFENRINTKLNG